MNTLRVLYSTDLPVNRETPSLGKYVQTLTFDLTEYEPIEGIGPLLLKEEQSRTEALAPLATYFYAVFHPRQAREARKFKAGVRNTKAFIASLDQLTNLVIQWHFECCPMSLSHKIYTDIFLLGWSIFGSRLRSLSLHMTTESYSYLFAADLYLPQLERLTLDLYKSHDVTNSNITRSSPTPFINLILRHIKTLTSLHVMSLFSIDREAFYTGIGKLPNLRTFNLEEVHQHQELSPPTSFLLLNSAALAEFSWSLKISPNWMTTSIPPTLVKTPLEIHFPKLTNLALNITIFQHHTADTHQVMRFLARHAELLTSLTLDGECFLERNFRVQMSQLRTLDISVYHIKASTFPTLATHLPCLGTLTIKYENFGVDVLDFPAKDSSTALTDYLERIVVTDLFVKKIQKPPLRNWQLHTLILRRKSYEWDSSLEYAVAEVITENIPYLQFINEMERRDFLRLTGGRSLKARVRRQMERKP